MILRLLLFLTLTTSSSVAHPFQPLGGSPEACAAALTPSRHFPENLQAAMKVLREHWDNDVSEQVANMMLAFLKQNYGLDGAVELHPDGLSWMVVIRPGASPDRLTYLSKALSTHSTKTVFDTRTISKFNGKALYFSSPRMVALAWDEALHDAYDSTTIHELIHHIIDMIELVRDHELAALRLQTRELHCGDQFHFETGHDTGIYSFDREEDGRYYFVRHSDGHLVYWTPANFWSRVEKDLSQTWPTHDLIDLGPIPPRLSFYVGHGPLGAGIRKEFHKMGLEYIYLNGEFRFDEFTAVFGEYLYLLQLLRPLGHSATRYEQFNRLTYLHDVLKLYARNMSTMISASQAALLQRGKNVGFQVHLDVDRLIPVQDADDRLTVGFSSVHLKLNAGDRGDLSTDAQAVDDRMLHPALQYIKTIEKIVDANAPFAAPRSKKSQKPKLRGWPHE